MSNNITIKISEVIDINDPTDGDRIKVRLMPEDNNKDISEIPYALPLLPKHLHIKPKIGESVLIIMGNNSSHLITRYYIGPIISQPQYLEKDYFLNSLSTHPDSFIEPDIAPSTNPEAQGALPKDEDIAIYGRKKNDIILSENDVKIRCGHRHNDKSKKGGIVFNDADPAFILLRHNDNETTIEKTIESQNFILDKNNNTSKASYKNTQTNEKYCSTATIVADKINLLGNNSKEPFNTKNRNHLIDSDEMKKIIEQAHQLPYGDVLVDFLKLFVRTFLTHAHPYPGMTPCQTSDYLETSSYDLNKILSESVRIN